MSTFRLQPSTNHLAPVVYQIQTRQTRKQGTEGRGGGGGAVHMRCTGVGAWRAPSWDVGLGWLQDLWGYCPGCDPATATVVSLIVLCSDPYVLTHLPQRPYSSACSGLSPQLELQDCHDVGLVHTVGEGVHCTRPLGWVGECAHCDGPFPFCLKKVGQPTVGRESTTPLCCFLQHITTSATMAFSFM